jgi:hypothetical protein
MTSKRQHAFIGGNASPRVMHDPKRRAACDFLIAKYGRLAQTPMLLNQGQLTDNACENPTGRVSPLATGSWQSAPQSLI